MCWSGEMLKNIHEVLLFKCKLLQKPGQLKIEKNEKWREQPLTDPSIPGPDHWPCWLAAEGQQASLFWTVVSTEVVNLYLACTTQNCVGRIHRLEHFPMLCKRLPARHQCMNPGRCSLWIPWRPFHPCRSLGCRSHQKVVSGRSTFSWTPAHRCKRRGGRRTKKLYFCFTGTVQDQFL